MSSTIFGKPLRIRCMQCDALIKDVYWCVNDSDKTLEIRVLCHGAKDFMKSDLQSLGDLLCRSDHVDMVAFFNPPFILPTPPAPPASGAFSSEPQ